MLPSAPGSAVMVIWFPVAAAERATGPLATQSVALICAAIFWQTIAGVTLVSVAGPEPSELDTATGPVTPAWSVSVISLLYVPPTVAEQLGSDALIRLATAVAIWALFRLPSWTP